MAGTELARRSLKSSPRIGGALPNWHQRPVVSADRLSTFVAPDEMLDELSAKRALAIHAVPAFSSTWRRA
jgi:hypothetical protein